MIYQPHHWVRICERVSDIALTIFPHIKSKKLKSEIISNLFETQSARYLKEQGFNAISANSDREPDLLIDDRPCEIKVTGIDIRSQPMQDGWVVSIVKEPVIISLLCGTMNPL